MGIQFPNGANLLLQRSPISPLEPQPQYILPLPARHPHTRQSSRPNLPQLRQRSPYLAPPLRVGRDALAGNGNRCLPRRRERRT